MNNIDALRDALELAQEGVRIHPESAPEYKVCAALIGMAAGIEALAASKPEPSADIHSCHEHCSRPECVAAREASKAESRAQEALK